MSSLSYITAIYANLLQPIVALFLELEQYKGQTPNQVQASMQENGHAAAVTVLAVLVVESMSNRARYLSATVKSRPLDVLRALGADAELIEDATELFILRDTIAHGHMWEAEVDMKSMTFHSVRLLPGYGDAKYRQSVDMAARKTRRLGLDVFPTRIHRATAITVLKTIVKIMRFFNERNADDLPLHAMLVRVGSKDVRFDHWVDSL